jgi:threonine dehydratase
MPGPDPEPIRIPTIEDIRDAARRIAGLAVRTPLLHSPVLSERCGRPVYLKPECLQRTGSFKFRGAYNRISRLAADERVRGVVAMSSGNHAQGVAAAAAIAGVGATIVMPSDAPAIKRANTRGLGATIVDYERRHDDRDAIARAIALRDGAILVPPYDDPDIIAGQGTVGLEIAEDAIRLGIELDQVVVPVSGGGLAAGTSLAIRALLPQTRVLVAEPEGFDDHARSLAVGARCRNTCRTGSLCDALLAPEPGELTFAINRETLSGGVVVSEREVARAVRIAFHDLKLVAEPGGAIALAAILAGMLGPGPGAVVAVISGGNVDAALFSRLIDPGQENSAS